MMMIEVSEFSIGFRKQLIVCISKICICNESQGTWWYIIVMCVVGQCVQSHHWPQKSGFKTEHVPTCMLYVTEYCMCCMLLNTACAVCYSILHVL